MACRIDLFLSGHWEWPYLIAIAVIVLSFVFWWAIVIRTCNVSLSSILITGGGCLILWPIGKLFPDNLSFSAWRDLVSLNFRRAVPVSLIALCLFFPVHSDAIDFYSFVAIQIVLCLNSRASCISGCRDRSRWVTAGICVHTWLSVAIIARDVFMDRSVVASRIICLTIFGGPIGWSVTLVIATSCRVIFIRRSIVRIVRSLMVFGSVKMVCVTRRGLLALTAMTSCLAYYVDWSLRRHKIFCRVTWTGDILRVVFDSSVRMISWASASDSVLAIVLIGCLIIVTSTLPYSLDWLEVWCITNGSGRLLPNFFRLGDFCFPKNLPLSLIALTIAVYNVISSTRVVIKRCSGLCLWFCFLYCGIALQIIGFRLSITHCNNSFFSYLVRWIVILSREFAISFDVDDWFLVRAPVLVTCFVDDHRGVPVLALLHRVLPDIVGSGIVMGGSRGWVRYIWTAGYWSRLSSFSL